MLIDLQTACKMLKEQDNVVIIAHRNPDGDTLGSCFALLFALEKMGKTARVECCDGYPSRYDFLYGDYEPKSFTPSMIVAVDVASRNLMGELEDVYSTVNLCIDHHKSNEMFAQNTLLDATAGAAAQIIYRVIKGLGVEIDGKIADCIFTGMSTDTGCFKYDSVSAETHMIAADLITCGARHGLINKLMFDTQTRGRLEIEKLMLNTLEYYFDDKCALCYVPYDAPDRFGVTEEELDGISALPRRIEGVKIGVTIREKPDGDYRISLRSGNGPDSSRICTELGGGGHKNAAGCTLNGTLDEVKRTILAGVETELQRFSL